MVVTIQIFILFFGVVIVKSYPHHIHYPHQRHSEFSDFFQETFVPGFHNGENPHNFDQIPSFPTGVYGAVNLFGSGDLFGPNDPRQDVNSNGDIGIGGNDIPNLNTGIDYVPGNYDENSSRAKVNIPNDVEVAKMKKRCSKSQQQQNSQDNPNSDTNQSQINVVLDNKEGQKNTDPVINPVAKELVPQNKSKEKNYGSIEHEINDTDVGLNNYRDVIVFPDNRPKNLLNRIGDNNYSSSTDNIPIKPINEQSISASNNQDKQIQYVNLPNSPSIIVDISNQEVPLKNSNGDDNVVLYPNIPNNNGNIGVNKPGQIYKPANSGTSNPGQVNVPGISGAYPAGLVYVPGNSGVYNPNQGYLPDNSGVTNNSQGFTPVSSQINHPGLVSIPRNAEANYPSQVYVPDNFGANKPGQVYALGYSGENSPGQIYLPSNSGANSPSHVYVPNNIGQVYAPGNYEANLPNNGPLSGDQITNGVYYNVMQSNNGQIILVPNNNGQPYVVDKGPNTPGYGQINKGQMYIPVKYNPAVSTPNGQSYLLLGNNLPGNTVTLGLPGNVIADKPTNNVPLLISYKDKEGDAGTSE